MSLPTASNAPAASAREELAALIATVDKLQLRANSLARTGTLTSFTTSSPRYLGAGGASRYARRPLTVLELEEDRTTLLERVQKNVPLMLEARAASVDIEVSFEPSVIKTWTAMPVAWEANPKKPNPFQSTLTHEGLREVRRNQAGEAAEDVANLRVRGDMHETEMLSMGLQLEGEHFLRAARVTGKSGASVGSLPVL
ncbi:hypothetical protein B0H19DRAFT_1075901 [Mycena capillaripes]|nr:hypothetical protein B0H19DRAFT_1075901 [Mycena capillaripes]